MAGAGTLLLRCRAGRGWYPRTVILSSHKWNCQGDFEPVISKGLSDATGSKDPQTHRKSEFQQLTPL